MKSSHMVFWMVLADATTAAAHHAMEFIEVESYSIARKGQAVLFFGYDYYSVETKTPGAYHWEFTPGVTYGVADWLQVAIHTHLSMFGSAETKDHRTVNPFLEAVAPDLQLRPFYALGWPIDIGFSLGYEVPLPASRDIIEGTDALRLGLVIAKTFDNHMTICSNFGFHQEIIYGRQREYTWGLAFKTPLTSDSHGVNFGTEFFGNIRRHPEAYVLPGFYVPIVTGVIVKAGVGAGLTSESEDWQARTMLLAYF